MKLPDKWTYETAVARMTFNLIHAGEYRIKLFAPPILF